jgi:peptidoglycan/LPS O-acetylase OafA/YrhL
MVAITEAGHVRAPHGAQVGARTEFFPALETLRGLAALGVGFYHIEWVWPLTGWAGVDNAWILTDLFFVLSGFVLAHVYSAGLGGPGQLRAFAVKRFFRLYPLHLAMLLVFVGMAGLMSLAGDRFAGFISGNDPLVTNLLAHLTLTHAAGWAPYAAFNTPSWSISAEAIAYTVFAAIAALALKPGWRAVALLGAAAGALFWLVSLQPDGALFVTTLGGAQRAVYGFCVGAALQLLLSPTRSFLSARPGWAPALQLAGLVLVGLMVAVGVYGSPVTFLAPLAFAPVILAFAAAPLATPSKAFSAPWLVWLGTVSYSFYMVHFLVALVCKEIAQRFAPDGAGGVGVDVAVNPWLGLGLVGLYFAASLVAAWALHLVVERPSRALGRRLAQG